MKTVRFSKAGHPVFVALGVDPATGVEARGPEGQGVSGGPRVEEQAFARARTARFEPRGNSTYVITFSVWRTFATPGEAEDFLATHPAELPNARGFVCEITLNSGSIRYLTTPVIAIEGSSIRGVTVRTTYRLSGGRIQKDKPTEA